MYTIDGAESCGGALVQFCYGPQELAINRKVQTMNIEDL